MATWWAQHAWLGGPGATAGVVLETDGERFRAVTAGVARPPAGAVRLEGLTLPGLANAHSHAFHRALRGRTHDEPGSFWTWRQLMYDVAGRLDPDSYRRLARAVYAEMALAGFTAVGEFHYLHHGPGGVAYADPNEMGHALAAAAGDAGVRLTLLDACYLRGGFGRPLEGPQRRFGDTSAEGWIDRVADLKVDNTVKVGAAIHSVRAVPPEDIDLVAEWAAAGGRPLHAHVSEQAQEHIDCLERYRHTPLGIFDLAGAVGPRFTAVHGTHFSEDDVAVLGAAGGSCCLCPTTERDLGDGIGPAAELYEAGVRLSVGSDSHAVIDAFEEARAVELDARLKAERRGLFFPSVLLEMATSAGMSALGWDAGVLAAGQLADFVTIRLDTPHTAGAEPSAAAAVFAAGTADVAHVVIGGRPVVSEGRHLALGDVAGELAAAIGAVGA